MSEAETVQRGPVEQVVTREFTEPLSDELVALIEASGLTVRDLDNRLIAYRGNRRMGAAWRQDNDRVWFGLRDGTGPKEYADRDAAVRFMLGEAVESR